MKNIVVIGGGTAGWITALYAKKNYPENNITVIDSSDVGIIGAGEGSTPHIIEFLNFLEIDPFDLIKNTNSTIKNGINFLGFSTKHSSYFHAFDPLFHNKDISEYYCNSPKLYFNTPDVGLMHTYSSFLNKNTDDANFMKKISSENKIPLALFQDGENISLYEYGPWALHFDAYLLAEYLKKISVSRGIKHVDDFVLNIENKDKVYISTKNLEIIADFIFDASGFKRLSSRENDFVSLSSSLPMSCAVPFIIEKDINIRPFTQAVAANSGWIWEIPLQNRTGCGYVFDSSIATEEDIIKEIYEKYPDTLKINKSIYFNPGYLKNPLSKGVLSVGLSAGFIEPMEASSIWQLTRSLQRFFSIPDPFNASDYEIYEYNKKYEEETLEIADFIYIHYITKKTNSIFWKTFVDKYQPPTPFSEKIVNSLSNVIIPTYTFNNQRMYFSSYYQILYGNESFSEEIIKRYAENSIDKIKPYYDQLIININNLYKNCIDHERFIEFVKGQ